jgi:hypothetical protein
MKAIWDNIRGLDLLDSLSYVKHGKYGAIGHSLGGHNSVYTAVFEERLKVVISCCGLGVYLFTITTYASAGVSSRLPMVTGLA